MAVRAAATATVPTTAGITARRPSRVEIPVRMIVIVGQVRSAPTARMPWRLVVDRLVRVRMGVRRRGLRSVVCLGSLQNGKKGILHPKLLLALVCSGEYFHKE